MIKYDNVELIPINNNHLTRLIVWLNNTPKSRLRLVEGRNLLDTDDVQALENASIDIGKAFFAVICDKSVVGVSTLGPVDWRSRRIPVATFVDPGIESPVETESKALRALLAYAFDELGMNKVTTETLLGDAYLSKMYERAGFTHEVRKRNHYFSEGSYHHVLESSILASEYKDERNISSTTGEK